MATALPVVGGHRPGFGATERSDSWWAGPGVTFLGLCAAIAYLTAAMLLGDHYYFAPYLSPTAAPVLLVDPSVAGAAPTAMSLFGVFPDWWPWFVPMTPGFLILAAPGSFRFTCYYYRKAYYRSFAGSPPGCAVGPVTQRPYRGETKLMIFQNLHRYALYLALLFNVILFYDAFISFQKDGVWGIGVGSLVMLINACLLCAYSFGCHSFRHLIGGRIDVMAGKLGTTTHGLWKRATWFNERHMQFAWMSLFWVCFTDFYVRMCSMGVIPDLNTWS